VIHEVSHRTRYRYEQPVSISHHVLHLAPRPCAHQVCHRTALSVSPTPAVSSSGIDYFGNPITFMTIQEQHTEIVIQTRSVIEVSAPAVPEPASTAPWDGVFERLQTDTSREGLATLQFAFDSPYTVAGGDAMAFAQQSFAPGRPILEAALDLTARIFHEFKYDGTATTVATPVDEVMKLRHGVCQDFAHLELACLRAIGVPARYVSGYLLTYPPEGQEKLVGADASHAWLSVWCPDAGWVDLDPTNNKIPTDEHITLAWGRDYGDVSPINGVIFGGGEHTIDVAVDVRPTGA
jgi:transglutaminase-like putative cysteine protease